LISLVVCRIECYSSCNVLEGGKLGCNEWWGGWGIYSPNHQKWPLGGCLSHGAPDSPVRHRTLSGAPATSAGRWVLTIGALTSGASGLSGGAPDRSYRLSECPSCACSNSSVHCSAFNAVAVDRWREVAIALLSHRTVWCDTGQSGEL
jgi:hypothetical protein